MGLELSDTDSRIVREYLKDRSVCVLFFFLLKTEAVTSLSSKPPDFIDKNNNFTSQNTGVACPPLHRLVSLFESLCDFLDVD